MTQVYFIGAGPGDPELITMKGQRLISEADVVIYAGSLVNPEILTYCKEDATIYNSAQMNLDEVLDVTKKACAEGKIVARVHTGDPAIYGAIQEQMDALKPLGIEYGREFIFGRRGGIKAGIYVAERIADSDHHSFGRTYADAGEGAPFVLGAASGNDVHFPFRTNDG